MQLPSNPATALVGIHPREKNYVHVKFCTQTLTVALFVIAKKCNQHQCPSAGEGLIQTVK